MKPFTLAHFTDAHIPFHGRFRAHELGNKRAISALNWKRKRRRMHRRAVADELRADILAHKPDHVAMTGDVVNFGLPREYEAAAKWLAEFGPAEQLSYVPGNHEAMVAGTERELREAFAAFTEGDEGPGFPWLRRRGPLALIGVSTAIPTAPGLAQGAVSGAQMQALRALLEQNRGLCRVILMHHAPTPVSPKRRALRQRAEVSRLIGEAGAELVLHGHNHLNQMSWIEGEAGRIPVLGAPSASTPAGTERDAAEWRLLRFEKGETGFTLHVTRRALSKTGGFENVEAFSPELPPPPAQAEG